MTTAASYTFIFCIVICTQLCASIPTNGRQTSNRASISETITDLEKRLNRAESLLEEDTASQSLAEIRVQLLRAAQDAKDLKIAVMQSPKEAVLIGVTQGLTALEMHLLSTAETLATATNVISAEMSLQIELPNLQWEFQEIQDGINQEILTPNS